MMSGLRVIWLEAPLQIAGQVATGLRATGRLVLVEDSGWDFVFYVIPCGTFYSLS